MRVLTLVRFAIDLQTGLESPRRTTVSGTATQQLTQQDAFVYNAGVERQFFDVVKASLTSFSRDGQAYAEFIKTLDMYSQEILSRNDMMGYVERLLGKRKDLIEEFKRIINAVGSPDAPTHDDSWHSVPLSEIDFSRCRRCSPSYRALPRDYPNPPCSERSNMEKSVLNDVWVSLPMGSEESNNFRHMRKNQYEETLFRCEDMRFEIDMCIDSNASTLQRLSKIFDELRFLSRNEMSHAKSIISIGAGLGGKVYQYTLDGRVLGVIHKHVIRRIYGDDGHEILELCVKNPSVALPIVVNRLRQKNEEFCAARFILNKKWKDIAEHNYYMSLDHRSITWRTTDKRATSTRTIVSEIKERAAHNGLEGESATGVRMEKAKEEHGIFYEVTMGCAISRKMDLTGLPLPTKTIFTPHLSLIFDSSSWAQRDAYRIIAFALERSSINPGDKERCNRLWREIIGPWFGLRLSWMQSPAAMFTASLEELDREDDSHSTSTDKDEKNSVNEEKDMNSSGGEEDVADNGRKALLDNTMLSEEIIKPNSTSTVCYGANSSYFSTTNHIPYPPETYVSTALGEAKIIQYRDSAYEVSVTEQDGSTRTTCLSVNAVYGSIFPVDSSPLTEQLCANDKEELERPDDHLIIGTQCLYLFFRLHQILLMRLTIARKLATEVSCDPALGKHIEKLAFDGDPNEGLKRYESFLGLVYALIDAGNGSSEASEGGKYEDRVRHLLGNNAYELTTIDKLIAHILKHLQNMANDDILQNMIEVCVQSDYDMTYFSTLQISQCRLFFSPYQIYRRHESIGKFKPSAFRDEAAIMSEGENMYAFQICKVPSTDKKIVHFEFLGCIADDDEEEDDDVAQENEASMVCEF
jgi:paired amphipathic helix protein Sin3a